MLQALDSTHPLVLSSQLLATRPLCSVVGARKVGIIFPLIIALDHWIMQMKYVWQLSVPRYIVGKELYSRVRSQILIYTASFSDVKKLGWRDATDPY